MKDPVDTGVFSDLGDDFRRQTVIGKHNNRDAGIGDMNAVFHSKGAHIADAGHGNDQVDRRLLQYAEGFFTAGDPMNAGNKRNA